MLSYGPPHQVHQVSMICGPIFFRFDTMLPIYINAQYIMYCSMRIYNYCHFVSNLQGKQGLIRNSAKFKTQQFSSASAFCIVLVHNCLRRCQELYYLFIIIIYFRLVGYIATCTVYTNMKSYKKTNLKTIGAPKDRIKGSKTLICQKQ